MSQYKSILKATSIFGGVQLLQIMITLVRSKFVALLIGATGMGLNAMYTSSISMVVTIFGMGISTSVVRDLSKANDNQDDQSFSLIIGVFYRMLYALSLLGMSFVILFSSLLSVWSFGNNNYTSDFRLLSLVVFFTLLAQGNQAKLVGKRKIKDLAMCSLIGAIVTLGTSIPFFYFFRLEGIVPGILVSSFANYMITYFYSHKVKIPDVIIKWKDVYNYGFGIFTLGFSLVIAVLIGNVTVYLINIGITKLGGLQDLGYYNAGMSMTGQVVAMVFSAMSADYYPRLVAALKDVKLMNETINEQCEILIHLSSPILILFSILSPLIIRLLLSEEFLVLNQFVRILCFGMLLKAIGYSFGNLSFAKGDKLIYMSFEGGYSNFMNLVLSIGFYYLWGLKGIAFAFVACWLLYLMFIYMINHNRYNYVCEKGTIKVVLINIISAFVIVAADCFTYHTSTYYYISISVAILVIPYNIILLNDKTNLLIYLREKWKGIR